MYQNELYTITKKPCSVTHWI